MTSSMEVELPVHHTTLFTPFCLFTKSTVLFDSSSQRYVGFSTKLGHKNKTELHNGQPVALATTKRLLGSLVNEALIFNFVVNLPSKAIEHSISFIKTYFASFSGTVSIPTDLSAHLASSLDQITSCCPNTNMPSRPPVSVVSYTSPDSVNTVSPCLTCTLQ